MHQFLYVSNCSQAIPASDLDDILVASRKNNIAREITGMLLYIDGGFLQILEGTKQTLDEVYARIAADKRHFNPRLLLDRNVPARCFVGWSMGFEHLRGRDGEIQGMFGITSEAIAGRLSPGAGRVVATMLETFYRVQLGQDLAIPRTG
jgi:hypothetical protein